MRAWFKNIVWAFLKPILVVNTWKIPTIFWLWICQNRNHYCVSYLEYSNADESVRLHNRYHYVCLMSKRYNWKIIQQGKETLSTSVGCTVFKTTKLVSFLTDTLPLSKLPLCFGIQTFRQVRLNSIQKAYKINIHTELVIVTESNKIS